MSISDRSGTAKNFVLASRSGLDATYVCTNPTVGDAIQVIQRQTRPTKPGQLSSVNVKCIVSLTDPATGITWPVDANLTVRFRNDDRATSYNDRVQQAIVLAVRSICPFDAATIVGTQTESNLRAAVLGALPSL